MEPILNLDIIVKLLDEAEVYEDEDGNKIQTIYLGSVLQLTPSGKIYTTYANSNVNLCNRCKGTGEIKNKLRKKKKHEQANIKNQRETQKALDLYGNYSNWPEKTKERINKIRRRCQRTDPQLICPECHGLGSLEARLDQDWWEQLKEELDTIEAWSHNSDGDGCDVMISRCAEKNDHDNTKEWTQVTIYNNMV